MSIHVMSTWEEYATYGDLFKELATFQSCASVDASLAVLYPLTPILYRLKYNPITNWYNNLPDVDITVPGFGDTDTVECLADSYLLCLSEKLHYFKEFVDYFVAKGYQRGVDIRAAPYDWRLAAGE